VVRIVYQEARQFDLHGGTQVVAVDPIQRSHKGFRHIGLLEDAVVADVGPDQPSAVSWSMTRNRVVA
jgi:hypothetical protein